MNYTIEKRTNGTLLFMHLERGLGNQAMAQLACSRTSRYEIKSSTNDTLDVKTTLYETEEVNSVIKHFEELVFEARKELKAADELFEALQTWREYIYGKKP